MNLHSIVEKVRAYFGVANAIVDNVDQYDQAIRLGVSSPEIRAYQRIHEFQLSRTQENTNTDSYTNVIRMMNSDNQPTFQNANRNLAANREIEKEKTEKQQAIEQGFAIQPVQVTEAPPVRHIRLED